MKRYLFLMCVTVILYSYPRPVHAITCDATHTAIGRWEIINILRRDGFSGIIDEYMELKRFGHIQVREACFIIVVYQREFQSAPETNPHYAARLILIKNYEYVGMYAIDESPTRIRGNTIEFPGNKELGNSIVLNRNDVPQKIRLNGEFRELFK
jgi:hypothetical protein